MNSFERIAAFADQHDRPRASEIRMNGVVIFSEEVDAAGVVSIVEDVVTTMAQARAVLGY